MVTCQGNRAQISDRVYTTTVQQPQESAWSHQGSQILAFKTLSSQPTRWPPDQLMCLRGASNLFPVTSFSLFYFFFFIWRNAFTHSQHISRNSTTLVNIAQFAGLGFFDRIYMPTLDVLQERVQTVRHQKSVEYGTTLMLLENLGSSPAPSDQRPALIKRNRNAPKVTFRPT